MIVKRILFVGISSNNTIRGVERVVFETIKALARLQNDEKRIAITLLRGSWQTYYDELKSFDIELIDAECQNSGWRRHLYLWFCLPLMARRYDAVHLFNTLPMLYYAGCELTVTIHDVAEYAMPTKYSRVQGAYRRLVTRYLSRVASTVFTVSDFSRREIERYLHPNCEVVVILNGLQHLLTSTLQANDSTSVEDRLLCTDGKSFQPNNKDLRFFLYFGVVEKTKGLDIALKAFRLFKMQDSAHRDTVMLVVGAPGNLYADVANELRQPDIYYSGFLSDSTLFRMVQQARAVPFLSEYEGFGFPAAEALLLGANVIVGRGTVLEEVCEPHAIVVDLDNIESVAGGFARAAAHCSSEPELANRRSQLSQKYDWNNAAELLQRNLVAMSKGH